MRPLVAVTCDRRLGPAGTGARVRPSRREVVVGEAVVEQLRAAGAIVVLVPPGDAEAVPEILARVDAVVVTGGAFDIHPRHYGQAVTARLDRVDEARTDLELELCRLAVASGKPVLGICGGMQALAVALGGTLLQDIRTADPGSLDHEQPTDPAEPAHALVCAPGWEWLGEAVNSTHHQAVADPGPFEVVARALDGVPEAITLPDRSFVVGVQWHPELLPPTDLFARLVAAAGS